jgi:hypothetical protein
MIKTNTRKNNKTKQARHTLGPSKSYIFFFILKREFYKIKKTQTICYLQP